jgi:hypothetical protein
MPTPGRVTTFGPRPTDRSPIFDTSFMSKTTDVNPQPPKMMSVAPGATEQAETNGRSQVGDPRAFGMCHQK